MATGPLSISTERRKSWSARFARLLSSKSCGAQNRLVWKLKFTPLRYRHPNGRDGPYQIQSGFGVSSHSSPRIRPDTYDRTQSVKNLGLQFTLDAADEVTFIF